MKEYIDQTLDSFQNRIKPLVLKLEEENTKKSEKETIEKINMQLEKLNDILNKTKQEHLDINNLCNCLIIIYHKNIPALNTLFETYHYLEKIEEIIEKMKEMNPLSLKEEDYVHSYLHKIINNKNCNIIFEYAISQSLRQEPKISFSLFKSLFISQVKMLIPNKKLHIISLEKDLGRCYEDFIVINEKHLHKLYEGKDITPIITIYHEMRHLVQRKAMKNPTNMFTFNMLKERILREYEKDYYDENYARNLEENDANYFSFHFFEIFCKQIGIQLKKETIELIAKEKKHFAQNCQNQERIYKGNKADLNTIFESFIKDKPYILNLYPPISMFYQNQEGIVCKKTFEQCIEEIKDLENKKYISKEEIQNRKNLYKEVLLNNIDIENSNQNGKIL